MDALDFGKNENEGPNDATPLAKLLSWVSSSQIAVDGIKIAQNFTYAALYLAVLMNCTEAETILNVPDDMKSFFELVNRYVILFMKYVSFN